MHIMHTHHEHHAHISCMPTHTIYTPSPPPHTQTAGSSRPIVRKKAALALLRLIRKSPPDAEILPTDVWSVKMVSVRVLVTEKNGVHCVCGGGEMGGGEEGEGIGMVDAAACLCVVCTQRCTQKKQRTSSIHTHHQHISPTHITHTYHPHISPTHIIHTHHPHISPTPPHRQHCLRSATLVCCWQW